MEITFGLGVALIGFMTGIIMFIIVFSQPKVKVGQVWKSEDPFRPNDTIKVMEIKDGYVKYLQLPHGYVGSVLIEDFGSNYTLCKEQK